MKTFLNSFTDWFPPSVFSVFVPYWGGGGSELGYFFVTYGTVRISVVPVVVVVVVVVVGAWVVVVGLSVTSKIDKIKKNPL